MMNEAVTYIRGRMLELTDDAYGDFVKKTTPAVARRAIIGVRIPRLRALAKELANSDEAEAFMRILPHEYYEENNLHAFLIERIKDFEECIAELFRFLPYVDNWATCDMMTPGVLKKHAGELMPYIERFIASGHLYEVRYGIGLLLKIFSGKLFEKYQLDMVVNIVSDEYYVNMMRAWYFATIMAHHYDEAEELLTERRLDKWTHNKTIQKAIESRMIPTDKKEFLRTLRIK